MKLAASNIGWAPDKNKTVYRLMQSLGYCGLEIAPTMWFPTAPYSQIESAVEYTQGIKRQFGLTVCSMQSIWYGRSERIAESAESRDTLLDYTKQAISFAHAIGCPNLVFGCPRQRTANGDSERAIVTGFLDEIAKAAERYEVIIALEANPPIYNTNYATTTHEAIEIIKEINSPSLKLNLDYGTIVENEEGQSFLIGNAPLCNHVHISEPGLKSIQRREEHLRLRKWLEHEHYNGFVSLEMGAANGEHELVKSLEYISEVFG